MIKTVIFDIGNVLVNVDWWGYVNSRLETSELSESVTTAVWKSGWWEEMDRGVLPEEEVLKHIIESAPGHEDEVRLILDNFGGCLHKQDYAVPWVEELKSKGYRVLYLSNYSDFLIRANRDALEFIEHMDGGVFSHIVHMTKPDLEIYEKIISQYELVGEECLFIDDRPDNIEGARRAGINGIVFTNYEATYPEVMNYLENCR